MPWKLLRVLSGKFKRRRKSRRLPISRGYWISGEMLEPRWMLASAWQNPGDVLDVNDDGLVSPTDVLFDINELNTRTVIDSAGELPERSGYPDFPYWDTSGDGLLNPLDALMIITSLNGGNLEPTANSDGGLGFETDENTAFTTGSVLANDTDPDIDDVLEVVALDTAASRGKITHNDNGMFFYDPDGQFEYLASGESAVDRFTYTVTDGSGGFAIGEVEITVTGVNDPKLAGLALSGDVDLYPAFDPEIKRYSIYPGDITAVITATVTSNDDDVLKLGNAIVESGEPTVLPQVSVGESLPLVVTDDTGASTEYELVFVSHDFPRFDVLELTDGVSDGILYFAIGNLVMMTDNYGVPYWFKEEVGRVSDFKLHDSGTRSYIVRPGDVTSWGRPNAESVLLDESFEEVARHRTVGLENTDSHDFLILPNGNLVLMAYEGAVHDLSANGMSEEEFVEDSVVQELTPTGEVVFQWSSYPEISVDDALRWRGVDYAHVNSIFVDDAGDYLLSLRGTSQVIKIDRDSGEVVWKMGGLSNEFTIQDDPLGYFCGQHTAQWLPNGNLLLFDNGLLDPAECTPGGAERTFSRVSEYAVDQVAKTARLVWSYSDGTYATAAGSVQRQPNGNTLVGWGRNTVRLATEVNSAGDKVFEIRAFRGDSNSTSYRVLRFEQ